MVSWFLLPITWCINHDGSPLRKDEVSYLLARVRSLFRNDFVSISLEKDLTIPSSPSEERSEWWGCFVFLRLLLSLLIVFVFLLLVSWALDIVVSFLFYHISFSRERFLILLLSAFSYYYERVIDFLLLCLPLQDLVFSKDLSSVILSLNLLWTEDALNDTILVDDESSAECTHVGATIHLLFTINTECLNEF